MKFLLNDEQESLFDTIQRFAQDRIAPRLRAVVDGEDGHDPALWAGLMELGLGGIAVPEAWGGVGLGLLDLALAAEALGYAAAPGPFLGHALCGLAIAWGGSDAQRERWLPRLAAGEALGSLAVCEAGGWQPEQWRLDGSGGRLTGAKRHVPYPALADVLVVGLAGGRLGLVERGAAGMEATPLDVADRTRRLWNLRFDGTPVEALPGDVAGRLRDAALVLLAADAFGGARRCVDMAVEYAKTREQFGGVIGRFQALKHQLANLAVEVEPCRGLYWYAAHAADVGEADAPRVAALAKAHVTDRFLQAARDTVEAHGGIGYTWECDVQIWFKRAMSDHAAFGTPSVHRERSAALAGW